MNFKRRSTTGAVSSSAGVRNVGAASRAAQRPPRLRRTYRLYAGRAAGRHRDHRYLGGLAAAGDSSGAGTARRTACQSNMKQIGLATLNFGTQRKYLPPLKWIELNATSKKVVAHSTLTFYCPTSKNRQWPTSGTGITPGAGRIRPRNRSTITPSREPDCHFSLPDGPPRAGYGEWFRHIGECRCSRLSRMRRNEHLCGKRAGRANNGRQSEGASKFKKRLSQYVV